MPPKLPLHKKPLAVMLLPAAIVILLANLLIPDPDPDDPLAVIEKASACENDDVLNREYRKLIDQDFFNVEYHRGYINSRSGLPHEAGAEGELDDDRIRREYEGYAADPDPRVADIGHYGLGYFYASEDDHQKAKAYFLQVENRSLKYLNSSLGYVCLKLKEYDAAKEHFYEEIRLKGNLRGAYSYLGRTLLETRQYDELERLVDTPEAQEHVSAGIIRLNHLVQREYGQYLLDAFDLTDFTYPGLLCALLILLAWFFYLRRVDVFEPEKMGHLLLTLLLGMAFSTLTTPLYDVSWVYLGFRLTGSYPRDLLFCIFGIGLIEETLKIVPVFIILKSTRAINESVDYFIYASVSALGFAFMENLLYFHESGLTSVSGRAFTAVSAHMALSSVAIYGLFWAVYRKKTRRYPYFALSFAAACAIHGIYDFWLVAEGMEEAVVFLSALVWICLVNGYGRIINAALHQSEYMPERASTLVNATNYLVYTLAGIILLEYVTVALKFGPQNANHGFLGKVILFLFMLTIFLVRPLGSFEIRERKWIPLFGKKDPT